MGRKSIGLAILAATPLLFAGPAFAHAMLEKAIPRVGEIVEIPPTQISLTFSERIEVGMSSIIVSNADGEIIAAGPPARGENAATIRIVFPGRLPPGRYKVAWSVLSVDGHATKGDYAFVISQ